MSTAPRIPSPTLFKEHRAFVLTILACTVALSVGWGVFARRLRVRDAGAEQGQGAVTRIWGGPLRQPQPRVRWRRADAATVELAAGEIEASQVEVGLDAAYRRRGVTEYPGYQANFSGDYRFRNPSASAAFVAFSVGLPVEKEALMLEQLRLTIDGQEDPAHTEYSPEGIVWTGQIAGARAVQFKLSYRARGLERFSYVLTPETDKSGASGGAFQPISNLVLTMNVRGARGELDYPTGAMSPTSVEPVEGGTRLSWKVDRLLTSFDVGVVLADTRGVTAALGRLVWNAPYFYLLYAAGLLVALRSLARRARPLHAAGLSLAYFLYFPLASYLVAYLPWPTAAALSMALISTIAVAHAARFGGGHVASRVALCQLFFLMVPATAYLLPAHTGLILVLAGVVVLALLLSALGKLGERLGAEDGQPSDRTAFSGASS